MLTQFHQASILRVLLLKWPKIAIYFTGMLITLLAFPESSFADLKKATELYKQRRYLEAAPEFFKIYSYPKNKTEKDRATYGLARSLEKADLPYSSSKFYSIIFLEGSKNPKFRESMVALGRIDSQVGLGRSHAIQLFSKNLNPSQISGSARGFYFYYRGIELFSKRKWRGAAENFRRVGSSSTYYYKAQFHLGVVSTITGSHSQAIKYFKTSALGSPTLRVQSYLNIARVNYEKKNFRQAFQNYANIQRDSEYWLDSIFESAWAFFILKKHNNVLGNIHTILSPFYEDRFYPEAYILQAITFLRLCRFQEVKKSQRLFRATYKPLNISLRRVLKEYGDNPVEFFNLVQAYKKGTLNKYEKAWPILNTLSYTNIFKSAQATVRRSENELAKLSNNPSSWRSVGLEDDLSLFLEKKRSVAVRTGGKNLFQVAKGSRRYLQKLTAQTDFIQLEINLGKISKLRSQLKIYESGDQSGTNFIGGLQELKVGQKLEYWPFIGEYWEDELGGYVFNISSKCEAGKS
ncbi:MAG: hypothetical protein OXC40_00080 [Proteobacteria bacterium]|nr:hypothetical protein [Pseudomonadota bacterium]